MAKHHRQYGRELIFCWRRGKLNVSSFFLFFGSTSTVCTSMYIHICTTYLSLEYSLCLYCTYQRYIIENGLVKSSSCRSWWLWMYGIMWKINFSFAMSPFNTFIIIIIGRIAVWPLFYVSGAHFGAPHLSWLTKWMKWISGGTVADKNKIIS